MLEYHTLAMFRSAVFRAGIEAGDATRYGDDDACFEVRKSRVINPISETSLSHVRTFFQRSLFFLSFNCPPWDEKGSISSVLLTTAGIQDITYCYLILRCPLQASRRSIWTSLSLFPSPQTGSV